MDEFNEEIQENMEIQELFGDDRNDNAFRELDKRDKLEVLRTYKKGGIHALELFLRKQDTVGDEVDINYQKAFYDQGRKSSKVLTARRAATQNREKEPNSE